ncbi:unnamed protein product [Symbiodinium microadriaticum]|nr:unnamed protein product [Symbiodinium microadriaticum]
MAASGSAVPGSARPRAQVVPATAPCASGYGRTLRLAPNGSAQPVVGSVALEASMLLDKGSSGGATMKYSCCRFGDLGGSQPLPFIFPTSDEVPREGWEYTKSAALVAPVINAAMYVIVVTFLITHPPPDAPAVDFGSLSSIVTAFQNPDGVFAGWLHYCVFDPLVGLGEVLDSQENKLPHALVATCLQRLAAQVPCLILTLLFGPMGFLLYLAVRTVTLASRPAASEA